MRLMTSDGVKVYWKCRQSKKIGRIKIFCLLLEICEIHYYDKNF